MPELLTGAIDRVDPQTRKLVSSVPAATYFPRRPVINRRFELGGVLSEEAVLTFMPNKRGNPNWGRPFPDSSFAPNSKCR